MFGSLDADDGIFAFLSAVSASLPLPFDDEKNLRMEVERRDSIFPMIYHHSLFMTYAEVLGVESCLYGARGGRPD